MDKRNDLIFACWKEGFILDEIAAMFKLDKARICQIVKKQRGDDSIRIPYKGPKSKKKKI